MRFVFLTVLLLVTIHLPWWVLLPIVVAYVYYYRGLELILLGGFVDVYFGGNHFFVPYFTLSAVLVNLVVEWIRPRLNIVENISL